MVGDQCGPVVVELRRSDWSAGEQQAERYRDDEAGVIRSHGKAEQPIFKSVASTSGQVATEYRYQPNVLANPDGTFTLLTMPAGMQVHPDTGEVRWTPGAAGQYNVDLQLQNSAGSSVQSFILNIP